MMKEIITIISIVLSLTLLGACKGDVKEISNPDKSGSVLDLRTTNTDIDFSSQGSNYFTDFQGVLYPLMSEPIFEGQNVLTEYPVMTTRQRSDGMFISPADPVIFYAASAPNYGQTEIVDFNFGIKYTSCFRLTDDTQTVIGDGCSPKNEPQGFIMAIIFLAGDEPHGALMAMAFRDDAFPIGDGAFEPALQENVLLTLNYDGESSGHLVAAADVPSLNISEFHTMSMIIHNDAVKDDPETGVTHGPTVSVLIDGEVVIKYWNDGNNHGLEAGRWDSKKSIFSQGDFYLAKDVLGITDNPQFFDGSNGVSVWNSSWETAIWRPSPSFAGDPVTSLVTFGAMFQIGTNEDNGMSKYKSPELKSIEIKELGADNVVGDEEPEEGE